MLTAAAACLPTFCSSTGATSLPLHSKPVCVDALDGDGIVSMAQTALGKRWQEIVERLQCDDVKHLPCVCVAARPARR
jgi:hypothetical protein